MNRYVVEFRTIAGKGNEAMQLFKEMKEYFVQSHGKSLEVFYQAFGTPGAFQEAMDFDSLAQLETVAQSLRRDPKYQELADKARSLFTEDSFKTTVYYRI